MGFLLIFLLGCAVYAFDAVVDAFDAPKLSPEVETLVRTALEDNSWLSLTTEQEFRRYCESIYSEQMIESIAVSLFHFVQENNDWHTIAKVRSIEVINCSGERLQLQAVVDNLDIQLEDNVPREYVSGKGTYLVTVVKENNHYKIAGIEEVSSQEAGEH